MRRFSGGSEIILANNPNAGVILILSRSSKSKQMYNVDIVTCIDTRDRLLRRIVLSPLSSTTRPAMVVRLVTVRMRMAGLNVTYCIDVFGISPQHPRRLLSKPNLH